MSSGTSGRTRHSSSSPFSWAHTASARSVSPTAARTTLALADLDIGVAIGWRAGHDGGRLRGTEGVGGGVVRAVCVEVEKRADVPHDAPAEGGHVLVAGCVEHMKAQAASGRAREDAVGNARVEMDVEIQLPAEALNPGHRAALARMPWVRARRRCQPIHRRGPRLVAEPERVAGQGAERLRLAAALVQDRLRF